MSSTEYCTTCGGAPHADGRELAGPPGHLMTWGRLAPHGSLNEEVPVAEEPPALDGPLTYQEGLPHDAPRNALWLSKVPTLEQKIIESTGIWKGKEQHVLGIAGICENGVRFYSRWRKMKNGWTSDAHWLKVDGVGRSVGWNELKGGLRERLGEL